MEYSQEIFDLIHNPEYTFYKLSIDGICQFEEFMKEVEQAVKDQKSFQKILNLMDNFSSHILLPNTKFRQILPKNKNERIDLYEFKDKNLRVYVILQRPNIYIVRGGLKKEQLQDINKFKKETKDFNK